MNLKAYRELVIAFDGTSLPDRTALASKLQFDYGKTSEFAMGAAQAFIDSLAHAEMLDQDNIVRKNGVITSAIDEVADIGELADADEEAQAEEIDRAFAEDEDEEIRANSASGSVGLSARDVPPPNVTLALTLDLSNFRAEEVVEILSSIGLANRG